MGQQPVCILHADKSGQSCGNIKLFVENFDKWLKVQECLRRRIGQQGSSKYLEIITSLGRSFEPHHGYHSNCYKNFTAIPEPRTQVESQSARVTRVSKSADKCSSSVLPPECIFCGKKRRKFKGKWYELGKAETFNAEINIRNAAKGLNDQELLRKIGTYDFGFGPDFPAMEVQYHHQCKKEYFNKFSLECRQKEGGSKDKKAKRIAFSDIVTIINDNCIGKNNPMQLADLLDRYKTVYIDEGGDEIKSQRFNVQNLAKKLRKQFEESELKIQAESTRKIIVWRGDLTYSSALNIAKQHSQRADNSIWERAMKLRKEMLSIQPKPLEEPLNA